MATRYAIGIDVGGTKIAAGIVNQDGTILHRHVSRTHAEQPPPVVISAIEETFRELLSAADLTADDIEAVGVGFPGNINRQEGVVLACSNLPDWDNYSLRDELSNRLGVRVILDNDTNMGVMGEHRFGAGRGASNLCYLTISTGLGMGMILDNRLYRGHIGSAGEVGHVVIEPNGPLCGCGKRGCLMAYASGIAVSRMAYEKINAGAETKLAELIPADGHRFPTEVVLEAAEAGDAVAEEILRTAARYLGLALSIAVQILNPERIVVGGGLTRIGPRLWDVAEATMREHTQPQLWDSVRVVPWELGDNLGVLGAAAIVFAGKVGS